MKGEGRRGRGERERVEGVKGEGRRGRGERRR